MLFITVLIVGQAKVKHQPGGARVNRSAAAKKKTAQKPVVVLRVKDQ
jgi:hypothetical protein